MRKLIENHGDAMRAGAVIVVTGKKLSRIRFTDRLEGNDD